MNEPIARQRLAEGHPGGGIAYITTTNRLRFSLRGDNGEYNVRFFNWLPRVVLGAASSWRGSAPDASARTRTTPGPRREPTIA